MIRHYLVSAFANIARAPFTTAANVLTLALGLACFIAAFGIATYWRSADGHHAAAERTFVVGEGYKEPGAKTEGMLNTFSSAAIARYLPGDVLEVEHVARATATVNVVKAGDRSVRLGVGFVDPTFFNIFDFRFVAGDPARAMTDANSIVLTENAAKKLFGDAPALGKAVRISDIGANYSDGEGVVAAVIAPPRQPSFMGGGPNASFKFDVLAPWSRMPNAETREADAAWRSLAGRTFVVLRPGVTLSSFNVRLESFVEARVPADQRERFDLFLRAIPLNELTTKGLDNLLFTQSGASLSAISSLLLLGALTLLVACVNYANLATAQAASRGKEIGMRRTLGAGRGQIMMQSWLEATILAALSVGIALLVLAAAAPAANVSIGVDILYFLGDGGRAMAVIGGLIAAVGLLAGAYPALQLSRVRPAEALASGRSRAAPRFVARMLVGIQFMSASFLLIVLTVAQLQKAELEKTAMASIEDPVVALKDFGMINVEFQTLRTRLEADPRIKSVTISDQPLFSEGSNLSIFARSAEAGAAMRPVSDRYVGDRYFETLGLDLLAGRAFDRDRDTAIVRPDPAREQTVIIDETFARKLGFATPQAAVGQLIYTPNPAGTVAARVIGVTETEMSTLQAIETPFGKVEGSVYRFSYYPGFGYYLPLVRIARADLAQAIPAIEMVLGELGSPGLVSVQFYDDRFREAYQQYARVSQLFMLLGGVAFFIASIGLLGIAVHVASRRRHEIAVRKTLGSSIARVIRLLLTDFSIPVLIGNLLAWPLGYLAAQTYLSAFASRIDLTAAPFLASMVITLLIAWAAVIGVVLKTATLRPADVLRRA
jgi:putative ABC transport system permease protein